MNIHDPSCYFTVSLKSLHVQDKGTFQLEAFDNTDTWEIDATNITVSRLFVGGA